MNDCHPHKLPRICIVAVWFGELPCWFDLWLASCESNNLVDFLIVTNQNVSNPPGNMRVIHETLRMVKERLEISLGVPVRLDKPYKFCDYKPFVGLAFAHELVGYDYWGFCDIDLVFGDLSKYLSELEQYDKYLPLGHLFFMRNTLENNRRVLLPLKGVEVWRDVVSTSENCAFDETAFNDIYLQYGFAACFEHTFADITTRQQRFTLGGRTVVKNGKFGYAIARYKNYRHQVFYWSEGKVGRKAIVGKRELDEEFMYVHFQKRRYTRCQVKALPGAAFYFGSEGFFPMEDIDTRDAYAMVNPYRGITDFVGGGLFYARAIASRIKGMLLGDKR